ncbi:uncharacterized protein HD556DRAFT_1528012 [Suillus plorans]|uniref:Uncharacterized protein n=1 Tax=Suillus plorans TaxID=116603 RepID=A0A9P7DGU0_9AGAM|nr:uncharacterized protein HD556DRAFT_1528012 [Suillus plorans]KAG1792303.1 hypothetical protein HD556DRAFT_1528012 [Suillus plorans]
MPIYCSKNKVVIIEGAGPTGCVTLNADTRIEIILLATLISCLSEVPNKTDICCGLHEDTLIKVPPIQLSLVLSALAYIVVLTAALPMQAAIAKRACDKRADLLPNVEKREELDPEPYYNDYNGSTYEPCGG